MRRSSSSLVPCLMLASVALSGLAACEAKNEVTCVGTPACLGEWEVFSNGLGEGQPCTTPAGDLHVRYERESSDELVALWSERIPAKLGLTLKDAWGESRDYRQAWYVSADGKKLLSVGIVASGSTKVRTVRLSWE